MSVALWLLPIVFAAMFTVGRGGVRPLGAYQRFYPAPRIEEHI